MYKRIVFIFFVFCFNSSFSQNFRWEFRAFMLRDFVKDNSIKKFSTYPLNNKECPTCPQVTTLEFDEEGKLIRMETSTGLTPKGRTRIKYVYHYETFPYYASKEVLIMNTDSVFIKEGKYQIKLNESDRIINETQVNNEGDTIRLNKLFFDGNYHLFHRESWMPRANYWIITDYELDKFGRLIETNIKTTRSELNDSIMDVYQSKTVYKNNRVENGLFYDLRWGTKDTALIITYHFDNNSATQSYKCSHQAFGRNGETDTKYYVIYYYEQGFIKELIHLPIDHGDTIHGKSGKGFEYEFYTDRNQQAKKMVDFIGIYLSPNMVFNDTW